MHHAKMPAGHLVDQTIGKRQILRMRTPGIKNLSPRSPAKQHEIDASYMRTQIVPIKALLYV